VEQQSAFLLQHRRGDAKISAGGTSGERDDMVVGSKRAVAGLVGSILGTIGLLSFPTTAVADPTGAQATLTAVPGSTGSGQVLIAPTARDHGTFAVEITINVKGASPDTVYTVSRIPDLNVDGTCLGAEVAIPPVTLETSAGGAGAVHFRLQRGAPFLSGTPFEVQFILRGDGFELRSECVAVTVK
jgi:hypothetical protein